MFCVYVCVGVCVSVCVGVCVPSDKSVRTKFSSSTHSVLSLLISLKALTGCPRKPSGSLVAIADRTSSLSAHLHTKHHNACAALSSNDTKIYTTQHHRKNMWPLFHSLRTISFSLNLSTEPHCLIFSSLSSSALM